MPKGYIQRMLAEGERIKVITRQHWFVVASAIFLESVLILLALVGLIVGVFFTQLNSTYKLVVFLACIGFILLVGFSMLRDILIWWNRQYIISSLRVIHIAGVINKNLIDSSLEMVNDVKLSQSILGRIFGYGDVEILTASELGVNLFRRIGNPVGFKTAMLNAKQDLDREGRGSGDEHDDDIPALLAQLDQLHKQGVLTDQEFTQKKQELLSEL